MFKSRGAIFTGAICVGIFYTLIFVIFVIAVDTGEGTCFICTCIDGVGDVALF